MTSIPMSHLPLCPSERNRSEEKVIMQKVTDVCEIMTHSQLKISKLIEVISKQEIGRSHKDKERKMRSILAIYKKKYCVAKRNNDELQLVYFRQKIIDIREELLNFMEQGLMLSELEKNDKKCHQSTGELIEISDFHDNF